MGKRDIRKQLLETFSGYCDIFEDDNLLLSKIKENIKQKLLDIPIQMKTRLANNGKLLPSNERDLSQWEPSQSDIESDDSSLSAFQRRKDEMHNDHNSNNTYGYYRFKYKLAKGNTKNLQSRRRYDTTKLTLPVKLFQRYI